MREREERERGEREERERGEREERTEEAPCRECQFEILIVKIGVGEGDLGGASLGPLIESSFPTPVLSRRVESVDSRF